MPQNDVNVILMPTDLRDETESSLDKGVRSFERIRDSALDIH